MKKFLSVAKKEILDALRDSKSLATVMLMPAFFAIIPYFSLQFFLSMEQGRSDIELPIDGAQHIAPLVNFFEESGIKVIPAPEDPEEAIKRRDVAMVLIVPDEFAEDFRAQKRVTLDLLSDQSHGKSSGKVSRVRNLIHRWSNQTGALRLLVRNVSPDVASPVQVNDVNITSDQRLASRILSGLPMFILIIAFVSGIGMTSEMASGERERRSLEPLLINPVSYDEVVFGKWLATVAFVLVVTMLGVSLQFFSVLMAPTAELGLRITLSLADYLTIILILVPLICLATSLQLFISFFAKSFKDAQSYNGLIITLPMAPAFYFTFNPGSAELWQMLVPILGPTALIFDLLSGDSVSVLHFAVSSVVSLTGALLLFYAAVALLKREKTIFG